MLADALQDIDQVRIQIDAVLAAGHDQALQDAVALSTAVGPEKHPGLAARRDRAQRALEVVGVDLNCVRRKLRRFLELISPRNARKRGQDPVRSDHGVRALDQLCAHRTALFGQLGCTHFVVCRAVSLDGLRATDLARMPTRHRGEPVGESNQAVRDKFSLDGQAINAGRCQRVARLAHLGRFGGRADSPCAHRRITRCANRTPRSYRVQLDRTAFPKFP